MLCGTVSANVFDNQVNKKPHTNSVRMGFLIGRAKFRRLVSIIQLSVHQLSQRASGVQTGDEFLTQNLLT